MIGLLLPFAVRLVGEKFARPFLYLALAALAIGAFFGAKALYDRSVVEHHEEKAAVKAVTRTLQHERTADAGQAVDEKKDQADAARLHEEVSHAIETHPVEARHSAGPAANAALAELRRRQSERRVGQHQARP
jgi:hypothetical protein